MKQIFMSMALAVTSIVVANEVTAMKDANFFVKNPRIASFKDGVTTIINGGPIVGKQVIPVDPAKKYQISAQIKSTGKKPTVYLGYVPLNAKKQQIDAITVNAIVNTLTTLAKPAKKGDKVIYVTNAATWRNDDAYGYVAFDAKKDFSDLPNNTIKNIVKGGISKVNNIWKIELKDAVAKDLAAGSFVRLHRATSTFIYSKIAQVGNKWMVLKGINKGIATNGIIFGTFWPKTKYVQVLVLSLYGDNKTTIDVKDLKVEEVK
jgi:hypothetical protein